MIPDEDLYKILIENEYVAEDELIKAADIGKLEKISLYEALLKQDLITDENLGKVIADYYKLPFVNLSKVAIDDDVLRIVPETVAAKFKVISFGFGKGTVKLATDNPEQEELIRNLSQKAQANPEVFFATTRDVEDILRLYKKDLQKEFDDLLKEQVNQADKAKSKDAPVAKLVDLIVEYAYNDKASDIHLEPQEESSLVRFRIDGVLHDMVTLPKALHEQVISRIKVLSKLRTDEHLSAQDGKMQHKLPEEELDIRVSIVPIVEGEKAVLRLLSSHTRQFSLHDLGMTEKDLEKVKNGFGKPFGMVLSTGPTGSGKTTSIYAILKILNTRDKNIATIEDPVEYEIEGINQIQVNPKTNLTFADGLRAILRQDPNVIFVGEIRDDETANIAVNSAMTGHLVVSTLHTNDAATALPRLIDMGIEPFLVASTVNVIIAQRLVRKICEKCRVSMVLDTEEIKKHIPKELIDKHFSYRESLAPNEAEAVPLAQVASVAAGDGEVVAEDVKGKKAKKGKTADKKVEKPKEPPKMEVGEKIRVYHGKGCPVCHHSGYQGRVGIFEILEVTENIRDLIHQKADSDALTAMAIKEGMSTMMDDGLSKVQQGVTTIEEVLRATKE